MTVDREKTIQILLLTGLCLGSFFLSSSPFAVAEVAALDMLIDVEGYTLEADLYTYAEYVAMMGEIGITPSDFILGETPVNIILASYQRGDTYVWQEVFEFASEEDAENEYDLQAVDEEYISGLGYQGNNGPIYQRFSPRERVFVHGRFLFLFFHSPLGDADAYSYMGELLPVQISHILETIGTDPPDAPTAVVDAAWGVEPGDVITWHVDDTTFTGSMGTGSSSSHDEWDGTWEIVDIQGGHILLKESSTIQYISTEDETRVSVNIPYDRYTWLTADEDGVSIMSEEGSPAGAVLFPLELNGVPLAELVEGSIDHLPEREARESAEYITVHGNTHSYSGFTPIETSWKDITVHRGTGIVMSSDFYYNNNEYSITTSTDISLKGTSFALGSRVPVILSLIASTRLSASTLTEGTALEVTVSITDQDGGSVSDAEVTAAFNDMSFVLSPKGSGGYETSLSTVDLEAGTYSVIVEALKPGFQEVTDSSSVVIQSAPSQPDSPTGPTGIPGFPMLSILMGAGLATLTAAYMNGRRQ
jgi:hypothetical protein